MSLSKIVIGCKWVFCVKLKVDRTLDKYKARLVAKGFLQIIGVDFFETFSLVIKHTTIRIILTMVISKDWELRQIDINDSFLNGNHNEDVYMIQPPKFKQGKDLICKLTRHYMASIKLIRNGFSKLST